MNINLVPASELVGIYDKKLMIKKIIIAASLSLFFVFSFVVVKAIKASKTGKLVKSLEEQYAKYTSLEKSITTLRKKITDNKERHSQLTDILPDQFYWSEKLFLISRFKDNDIWFNDLSIKYEDGYQCFIKGFLYNTDEKIRPISKLNNFVKKMKQEPLLSNAFSSIEVKDLKKEELNNKKVLGFTILMEYNEPQREE